MAPPICPRADEESSPPEDAHSISSDEDPYAPPDEVAPGPPTSDWFWGQYNLCLWKSLSPAEKVRKVAFKKEMAEEEARYQAGCEARDAAWKKEAAELWGRARRHAEEVYFARKVMGVGRLVAAWRWADKLQRATDEELRWVPNEMARLFALIRQQEAERYVKRYKAEEAEYRLHTRKTRCNRELLARGYRNTGPRRDY